VRLNVAEVKELDALPGIGPATAAAIVDHRRRNGPFRTLDDLDAVNGIGPARIAALRDLVVVD
jgi:competence protein ComEA